MPIGSIRSPGGVVRSTTRGRPFLSFDRYWYGEKPPLAAFVAGSDVQEAHVLCVALDERPPGLDVLAHQDAEQLVGERRIVESDLEQDAGGRVHGGVPQLLGRHLAQALEPTDPRPVSYTHLRAHETPE